MNLNPKTTITGNPICVALDTPDLDAAVALTRALRGSVGMVKIGMEFFYANGPSGYQAVAEQGVPVFLDLKLHDIPNTVAQGLVSLMGLAPRPAIINIHAGAGAPTMRAAAGVFSQLDEPKPKLIGLTVLTSLSDVDLAHIGYDRAMSPANLVAKQAELAKSCGLDGVVCSPGDIAGVKQACGPGFLTVVPGIRPADSTMDDQKRTATPAQARAAGADVLVIGRPITQASDPVVASAAILESLEQRDAG